jgi:3-oxoacyl-[acyl-carrier-protein] synthase II
MASSSRRVVLTGIGVVNPIGIGQAPFWDALSRGQSGVRPVKSFDASTMDCRIAAEVEGFDAKKFIDKKDRKSLRVMARGIQLAVAAAQLAVEDGKLDKNAVDRARFGVEFGAALLSSELNDLGPASKVSCNCQPGAIDVQKWGELGLPVIEPLWMLKYLPNMLACHVSIFHDAQGPNNTITESDVGGTLALGEAYRIILRDAADLFLVGGADNRANPLSLLRQCLFDHVSRRNDAPEKACRPFDKERDGIVVGEGGAVFLVEELEHARKRNARIYAEMIGFASSFDAKQNGAGITRAIRTAMSNAGVTPEDVDHVNAHGLGSPTLDVREAHAIKEAFAGRSSAVPVFAAKSYFGNLGAGGGVNELAASVLALAHGNLPRTLNYETPDPACPVNVVRTSQPVTRPCIVKVSFNELGQCAAVVCRRWE